MCALLSHRLFRRSGVKWPGSLIVFNGTEADGLLPGLVVLCLNVEVLHHEASHVNIEVWIGSAASSCSTQLILEGMVFTRGLSESVFCDGGMVAPSQRGHTTHTQQARLGRQSAGLGFQ